jgi:hypothetical protein
MIRYILRRLIEKTLVWELVVVGREWLIVVVVISGLGSICEYKGTVLRDLRVEWIHKLAGSLEHVRVALIPVSE